MRHLLLLALMTLTGCTALQETTEREPLPQASAAEAMKTAKQLSAEKKWSDAIDVLDKAIARFPHEQRLKLNKRNMQLQREQQRRFLEDQILANDAENQKKQIQLLKELEQLKPDDLVFISRRLYWEKILSEKLGPLVNCAEFHTDKHTALARQCFDLATDLPVPETFEPRLEEANQKLRKIEKILAEKKRAAEARARTEKMERLLTEAREASDKQLYRKALDILNRVSKLQPDNPEAKKLHQHAWSMLKPQIDALTKLGDRLYLDNHLEAAVGTWQAALTLAPNDEEIIGRIERARTVMERLRTLRQQQGDSAIKM